MAINPRQLISGRYVAVALTKQYEAVDLTAVIDAFAVRNVTSNNVTFTCYVVEVGESPAIENAFIYQKTIGPGEAYPCPEVVGRVIESGGYISTEAGTASALAIDASGREITPASS